MLELISASILLAPLAAAGVIGGAQLLGWTSSERLTARLVTSAIVLSLLGLVMLGIAAGQGIAPDRVALATWLESGTYRIEIAFLIDRLSLTVGMLGAVLGLLLMRFSVDYMHREPGFHRFFALLSLFVFAVLLLVSSSNAVMSFIGWEIAGLCSYLLIGYFHDRVTASANATRVFVTNRVGDAGFLLGVLLSYLWLGSLEWQVIGQSTGTLGALNALAIAGCFLLAAMAKSGLFPLSTWLARAMEGPTPSSALFYAGVMVHAGVYLILRLEPVLEASPAAMVILVVLGSSTAAYGFVCGLAQTDIKSSLIFSVSGQIGLMVLECGLGLWTLALVHLCAHAVFRSYQFLTAPSVLHQLAGIRMSPVPAYLAGNRFVYAAALNRWWLEEGLDAGVAAPLRRLARDLDVFDTAVIDRATGLPAPAVRALSSLAEWEERHVGAPLFRDRDGAGVDRARGLLGTATQWGAAFFHFLEDTVVLRGIGHGLVQVGHTLGRLLQRIEYFLGQPRLLFVLVAFVLLLMA